MSGLTEAQRAKIEQRVDEGVWFLDHVIPDWADRVDLSKLNFRASTPGFCGCVVAQVTSSDWWTGALSLGIWNEAGPPVPLGFVWCDTDQLVYAHELWQEAVLDRRPNKVIGGERKPVAA